MPVLKLDPCPAIQETHSWQYCWVGQTAQVQRLPSWILSLYTQPRCVYWTRQLKETVFQINHMFRWCCSASHQYRERKRQVWDHMHANRSRNHLSKTSPASRPDNLPHNRMAPQLRHHDRQVSSYPDDCEHPLLSSADAKMSLGSGQNCRGIIIVSPANCQAGSSPKATMPSNIIFTSSGRSATLARSPCPVDRLSGRRLVCNHPNAYWCIWEGVEVCRERLSAETSIENSVFNTPFVEILEDKDDYADADRNLNSVG